MRPLILIFLLLVFKLSFSQSTFEDTLRAQQYFDFGDSILTSRSNYDSSIYYFNKAGSIYKAGGLWTSYHRNQNKVAEALWRSKQYDESIQVSNNILMDMVERKINENILLGNTYNNIGFAHYYSSNYPEAQIHYERSLAIGLRILEKDHPDLANSYNNVANSHYSQGNYQEALNYYELGLDIRIKNLGEEHLYVAHSSNNLGAVNHQLGNYLKALSYYQRSLEIRLKILGQDHRSVGGLYNNIGNIYYEQGNIQQSIEYYHKGLEIRLNTLGAEHPYVARSYLNIGNMHRVQGNYDEALNYYHQSLDIRLKSLGEAHPEVARTYLNMGLVHVRQGNYEEAMNYYNKCLNIRLKVLGEVHPYVGSAYNKIGTLYLVLGEIDSANFYVDKSVRIALDKLGTKHPDYYETLSTQAIIQYISGDTDLAVSSFRKCNEFYVNYIGQIFQELGESEREMFYNTLTNYFEIFQNFAIKNSTLTTDLFDLQLAAKSILLNTSGQIHKRIVNSRDRVLIDLYDEVQLLKQQMGRYSKFEKEDLEQQGINLDSISDLLDEKDRQLSKFASFYANDKKEYSWNDVQDKLEKGEAAVEIIRIQNYIFNEMDFGDSVYYAALIVTPKTKDGPKLVVLKNGLELENKYINYYRNVIYNKVADKYSYARFWEPIHRQLKGIHTVYFSPDGVYNLLNMQTLFNEEKNKYLFEEINIRLMTSTKDLLEEAREPMPNKYAIIVGNPYFGIPDKLLEEEVLIATTRKRDGISALPGTALEIDAIEAMFERSNWRIQKWSLFDASEKNIKNMLKPKVLHIATHGFFEQDVDEISYQTNPLFRSGLLLTGAQDTYHSTENFRVNVQFDKDDGILTAFEAMNLNIDNTELVVLSACETGLGEIRNGEGVYGLQRAFKVAGAKSILTSLWKVDDKVTQELMIQFYENWLKGMSKREAFTNAQKFIKERYSDPYYWGAFVLIGN